MARKKVLELPDEVRAYFAAASARRVREERNCAVCGTPLGVVIRKRLYCGPACSTRASRERIKERKQEADRQAAPEAPT